MQGLVSRLGYQLFHFYREDLGRVGLFQKERCEDLDHEIQDRRCPEYPAPGRVLGDGSADDGFDGWAEERRKTVDGICLATFFGAPTIT
jgi:hypothetical protein